VDLDAVDLVPGEAAEQGEDVAEAGDRFDVLDLAADPADGPAEAGVAVGAGGGRGRRGGHPARSR
jgi:hypothetical protein